VPFDISAIVPILPCVVCPQPAQVERKTQGGLLLSHGALIREVCFRDLTACIL